MIKDLLAGFELPNANVDQVVYLGAGAFVDFDKIKLLSPRRTILVEANSRQVAELKRAQREGNDCIILRKLVVAEGEYGERELQIANVATFSSILDPLALSSYFPNIRVMRQESAPAITLEEICDRYSIGPQAFDRDSKTRQESLNVLIVDLNGYEAQLIESLSSETLHRFGLILCRTARQPLYSGAQPLLELERIFQQQCFKTTSVQNLVHPFVALTVSPDALKLCKLSLEQALRRNLELEQRLDEARTKLQQEKDAHDSCLRELEEAQVAVASLQNTFAASEEKNQRLELQLEEVCLALEKAHLNEHEISQTNKKVTEELEAALYAEKSKHAEVLQERNRLSAAIESLEAELVATRGKADGLDVDLKSAKESLDKHQTHEQEVEVKCEQLQQDLQALKQENSDLIKANSLNSKLLTKAQVDLKDLRQRYYSLKEAKALQAGVLAQVDQRLRRASKHYTALVKKHPELRELGDAMLLPLMAPDGEDQGR